MSVFPRLMVPFHRAHHNYWHFLFNLQHFLLFLTYFFFFKSFLLCLTIFFSLILRHFFHFWHFVFLTFFFISDFFLLFSFFWKKIYDIMWTVNHIKRNIFHILRCKCSIPIDFNKVNWIITSTAITLSGFYCRYFKWSDSILQFASTINCWVSFPRCATSLHVGKLYRPWLEGWINEIYLVEHTSSHCYDLLIHKLLLKCTQVMNDPLTLKEYGPLPVHYQMSQNHQKMQMQVKSYAV